MADRSLAESECQAAPCDERARRPHPGSSRGECRPLGSRPGTPGGDRRLERLCRRAERVENGLVTHRAAPTPGESRGRRYEHLRNERWFERLSLPGPEAGLDECCAKQRAGCPTDRRHEPVPDRAEEVSRRRLGGELSQELLHRPKSGREVVAVVTVTEDGVEPGERRCMAVDRPPGAMNGGPKIGGVDPFDQCDRSGRRGRKWNGHAAFLADSDRPSVASGRRRRQSREGLRMAS